MMVTAGTTATMAGTGRAATGQDLLTTGAMVMGAIAMRTMITAAEGAMAAEGAEVMNLAAVAIVGTLTRSAMTISIAIVGNAPGSRIPVTSSVVRPGMAPTRGKREVTAAESVR